MALATWKDLCLDAVDPHAEGRFWAQVLGLEFHGEGHNVYLSGPTPQHRVWINQVPEPHTVKNRVHLDVHTAALSALQALGARAGQTFPHWTVLTDPEDNEFCGFVRDPVPDYRLYELVVDCADAATLAAWWARVFAATHNSESTEHSVEGIVGMPFDGLVFDDVPEPKTVKNRVHWDVNADPADLIAAGATLLRAKGADTRWHVMADPEGNEFCAFDD